MPAARALAGGLTLGRAPDRVPLGAPFVAVALGYLGLNIAYSLWLKKVAFVDVGCICLGFVLRVLGGAFAVPVPPSRWLLVCTLVLSALLAFGKRAHELHRGGDAPHEHREVLGDYSPRVLAGLLALFGLATVVAYFFWARSQHATFLFGTERLVLTVPFVAFAVYRFVRIVGRHTDESPTDAMLHDVPFVANLCLYAVAVLGILYLAPDESDVRIPSCSLPSRWRCCRPSDRPRPPLLPLPRRPRRRRRTPISRRSRSRSTCCRTGSR